MSTRLLLLLLLLIRFVASGQQMQEFNQLYNAKEKENAIKAATAAIAAALDATAAGTAATIATEAANNALDGKAPVAAAQVAAIVSSTAASSTITDNESITKASAIPNFTSLLGNNILLPKIELTGTTNFGLKDSKFYGDIKLFTSAFSSKQSSNVSLFFPEASVYGVSMSFNHLPAFAVKEVKNSNGDKETIKMFCIYSGLNYLGKNLYGVKKNDKSLNDTTRFTSDFVHIKLGIQIIPITNIISVYADFNFLAPVVNRGSVTQFNPDMKNGFSNFWNFGTKFLLAEGAGIPMNLYLDLGFILVDGVTQTLYSTKDPLIPKLTIGGIARF